MSPGTAAEDRELFLFVVASDAAVGENRLPFVLRRASGSRVSAAPGDLRLVYGHRDGGDPQVAPDAVFREWPLGGGLYTTAVQFDRAGLWDFTLIRQMTDGSTETATAVALVNATPSTPGIGSTAPPTPSKTGSTPEELALITSSPRPIPALYAISVDDAVQSGRPVVVSFATPAYCQTQTCGPQVETLHEVQLGHREEAHFIHIEVFDNPAEMAGDIRLGVQSPLVEAWGLPSEPWTFVLNWQGRVTAKFEGYATAAEIEEALGVALAQRDAEPGASEPAPDVPQPARQEQTSPSDAYDAGVAAEPRQVTAGTGFHGAPGGAGACFHRPA